MAKKRSTPTFSRKANSKIFTFRCLMSSDEIYEAAEVLQLTIELDTNNVQNYLVYEYGRLIAALLFDPKQLEYATAKSAENETLRRVLSEPRPHGITVSRGATTFPIPASLNEHGSTKSWKRMGSA